MKELKEYFKELKEIIDSDLTENRRDMKLIDFLSDIKKDAIDYGENRVSEMFEKLKNK